MRDNQSTEMDEELLLAMLREAETDSSSYFDSSLAFDQAHAQDRYFGKHYGDEIAGRSSVVTNDISDAINWLVPALMRAFIGTDELVSIDDEENQDVDLEKDIGEYLCHVMFKDNPGEEIIHDYAFDGLLQRIGVISVRWEDPKMSPPRRIRGVHYSELEKYTDDPNYEIVSQDSDDDDEFWELEVKQMAKTGRVVIEVVPPEEFRFESRSPSIKDSGYHGRKTEQYLSDLMELYPEKADDLENGGANALGAWDDIENDPRALARWKDDVDTNYQDDAERRKCYLLTEYMPVDFDGDGTVELRQIKRVGNVILENLEVSRSEFVAWSPIRVSHKLIGVSIADTLLSIQKIRTVTTRKLLDSLSQSLSPRTLANHQAFGPDGLDQLLDQEVGDVISVNGDPNTALRELVTPDVSASAYQALQYFDQRGEEASGVTKHAQGLQKDAITDTAEGIRNLQAAANQRVELIGRWLGIALEEVFEVVYQLIVANQEAARTIKVGGKPSEMDPANWNPEARITIHAGQAAESREAKLQKLMVIAGKQEQILMEAGIDNPWVGEQEYRETLALMVREVGYKRPERFFKEIPEEDPNAPPEPPKPTEEELKAQAAQAESQAKLAMQKAELDAKIQLNEQEMMAKTTMAAQELKAKQAMALQDAQQQQQLDAQKAQANAILQEQADQAQATQNDAKLAHQIELANVKLENEREIALLRVQSEREIAELQLKQDATDEFSAGGDLSK